MTTVSVILCVIACVAAGLAVTASISSLRKWREAHGEKCTAERLLRQIPDWDQPPILCYIITMHDEHYVGLFGRYENLNEHEPSQDILIKKFKYNPEDKEDEDFAYREALELRDKLFEW